MNQTSFDILFMIVISTSKLIIYCLHYCFQTIGLNNMFLCVFLKTLIGSMICMVGVMKSNWPSNIRFLYNPKHSNFGKTDKTLA